MSEPRLCTAPVDTVLPAGATEEQIEAALDAGALLCGEPATEERTLPDVGDDGEPTGGTTVHHLCARHAAEVDGDARN